MAETLDPISEARFREALERAARAEETMRTAEEIRRKILDAKRLGTRLEREDDMLARSTAGFGREMRKVYTEPENAMRAFRAGAAKDPQGALDDLRQHPERFGDLRRLTKGRLERGTDAFSRGQAEHATRYARVMLAAESRVARPVEFFGLTDRKEIRAVISDYVVGQRATLGRTVNELDSMGGVAANREIAQQIARSLGQIARSLDPATLAKALGKTGGNPLKAKYEMVRTAVTTARALVDPD